MCTGAILRPVRILDFRSDTLTRPTAAMREAMASAELGDDVFGEDPTVNALEARCAELAGKQAALLVPSGTMANLIACRLHTHPGDEVIIERTSHLYRYEAAGFAAVAGCSVALLRGEAGLLREDQVSTALRTSDVHQPRSRLLWLENTHNFGGGTYYGLDRLRGLREAATAADLALHIDGARVFNACAAAGYALSDVAALADTLSFCFSKGLGCPVGSVLVGPEDLIARGRGIRKMLGGGMRQAGVLAGAALYALENHVERLADDHRRARALAQGLRQLGLPPALDTVPTNLLFVDTSQCAVDAPTLASAMEAVGVRAIATGAQRVRFVTHLDVDDADIDAALARVAGLDALRQ